MTNSQAVAYENWLVRCSHHPSRFRRSNLHIINHERFPIVLPRGLPGRHIPTLTTYTTNSAFPVSRFLANFHRDTAKNDHSTTTVHQEEPFPLSLRDSPTLSPSLSPPTLPSQWNLQSQETLMFHIK